jgi:hypothetical protein
VGSVVDFLQVAVVVSVFVGLMPISIGLILVVVFLWVVERILAGWELVPGLWWV